MFDFYFTFLFDFIQFIIFFDFFFFDFSFFYVLKYSYFGHGAGETYFSSNKVLKETNKAVSLLIGCSSGAVSKCGQYEPSAVVLNYLISGVCILLVCLFVCFCLPWFLSLSFCVWSVCSVQPLLQTYGM
jgi:hypothetical protein